jgi:hypothetical protein
MNRLFKICMLWLLVLAIPVQGLAAVTMLSCVSLHGDSRPTSAAATEHIHGNNHQHYHDIAGSDHVAEDASATLSDEASGSHGKDRLSSCSVCAACCVGTAVLPTGLTWETGHDRSEVVIVSPSTLITGYIPAGLERPPRGISA